MNKLQLSFQHSVSKNIFYTLPTPGVLKNAYCYSYKTNDSFFHSSLDFQQYRCESKLAIDILFLVSQYTNKKNFKKPHSAK